jgi:soluble lytic murein transglycosylase
VPRKTLLILLLFALLGAPGLVRAQAAAGGAAAEKKAAASRKKSAAKRPAPGKAARKKPVRRRRRPVAPPRLARVKKAFIASTDLQPMATQLMEHRSPAAYAGVEAYARRHAGEDAGALAWLLAGYCHYLDHEYAQAIEPLKKARPQAGELADYVAYFLADSYAQTGHPQQAVESIGHFAKTFNDSVLEPQAAVLYGTALTESGRTVEAVNFLAPRRSPPTPSLLLALGKAYAAAGELAKAIATLRRVYYEFPLSGEADTAQNQLKEMARKAKLPPPGYEQRKGRIEVLLARGRVADAAPELKDLLKSAPGSDRTALQLELAAAYFRGRRYADMEKTLDNVPDTTPEIAAEKRYYMLEDHRPDEERVLTDLAEIRRLAPSSLWMENALLATGNMYLLAGDYPNAVQSYTELYTRFPRGRAAGRAHWRAAWYTYRMRKTSDARRLFEEHLRLYPGDEEAPAAWYWLGRMAEQGNDRATAVKDYRYVIANYRMLYYGVLARQRLVALGEDADVPGRASRGPQRVYLVGDPPTDDLRAQKALLLENAALYDFAVQELQESDGQQPWALAEMVRMYQAGGRYDRSLRLLKRALPGYYSWDLDRLPRFFWEGLFPRPYWTELTRYANENGLDPLLVASLVRQESEFNPLAVSRAAAVGLMQVLPGTGRKIARDLKIRHFSASQLYDPAVNLQLGTFYFRKMLDQYDGHLEYALAAYNAGEDRVAAWRANGDYSGMDEFVESIPFTETREYVQAIVRNAAVYRDLYGKRGDAEQTSK